MGKLKSILYECKDNDNVIVVPRSLDEIWVSDSAQQDFLILSVADLEKALAEARRYYNGA